MSMLAKFEIRSNKTLEKLLAYLNNRENYFFWEDCPKELRDQRLLKWKNSHPYSDNEKDCRETPSADHKVRPSAYVGNFCTAVVVIKGLSGGADKFNVSLLFANKISVGKEHLEVDMDRFWTPVFKILKQ